MSNILQIPKNINLYDYNNIICKDKTFKYFSEIILLTNTKNIDNIIDWLYWHLNIIKFDHIVVVDNGATSKLKDICRYFKNVDYYYEEIHNQDILTTKYYSMSEANWSIAIDDDEYLYIDNDGEINEYLRNASIILPYFKFSVNWLHFYSSELLNEKPADLSLLECFNYVYAGNKTIIDYSINHAKVFVNNSINHYVIHTEEREDKTYDELGIEQSVKNSSMTDMFKSYIGGIHNPLTILNNQILPSYNLSNNKINYGFYNENDNDIQDKKINNICIAHYKHRSINEWIDKINNNKLPDVDSKYYENLYKLDNLKDIYKNSSEFIKCDNLCNLYKKYKTEINNIKNNILNNTHSSVTVSNNYDDITVLTCNFNNSYITMRMIESLYTQLNCDINTVIIDNSTAEKINDICKKYFTVIDNTNFKYSKNYNQPSKNHCAAIDYALKNCIKTKYVMLCDNDILFKPEIVDFINMRHDFDAIGYITTDFVVGDRLLPFCCIIDVEKFNNENLNYFDNDRCAIELPTGVRIGIKYNDNYYDSWTKNAFDTGASFYQDIKYTWNINNINIDKYILHYTAASHNKRLTIKDVLNIGFKYNDINEFYVDNANLLSIKP